MSRTDRDSMIVAYGYLWLFQGDSSEDINAHFAFMARQQLGSCLTKEEKARGIAMGRAHAMRNDLKFTEPA